MIVDLRLEAMQGETKKEIKGWILWEGKRAVVEKAITHWLFLWESQQETLQ